MPLKPKFNKFSTAAPAIASFSFQDIASGEGFINFFPINGAGLTTVSMPWDKSDSGGDVGMGAETINYDTSGFNAPRTIRGTARFTILSSGEAGGNFWRVRFYKVVGGTPTAISDQISTSMDATKVNHTFLIPLTTTKFNVGDLLRLELVSTTGVVISTSSSSPLAAIPFEINL
jgi:hypothetical protein